MSRSSKKPLRRRRPPSDNGREERATPMTTATEELFRQDSYLKSCEATVVAAGPDGVVLDRTVFYPVGGGQPGDTGVIRTLGGTGLRVTDTRKGEAGILHVTEDVPSLAAGDTVTAEIDWDRRHRLMRMHTCMHLLCAVVEGDVTGGGLGDGKGRIDFDLPNTALDKEHIAAEINRLVTENHPVTPRWVDEAELDAHPELVRTMSVQPPRGTGRIRLLEIGDVDLQPCGGTHVARTGEIGAIVVRKIENKGKQNRRVNIVFDE